MAGTDVHDFPGFVFPKRPDIGSEGSQLLLRANFFPVTIKSSKVFHYDVTIIPDRFSRKINRNIIEMLFQSYKNTFGALKPVYDGRNNLYTRNALYGKEVCIMEFNVTLPGDVNSEVSKVILKYVAEIDLAVLNNLLNSELSQPNLKAYLQALNVILKYSPSLKYTAVGRSFFSPPVDFDADLGGGREMWFGYYQTTVPSQWKMMLNIDVSASPFYKNLPVVEFMWEILGLHSLKDQTRSLTEFEKQKFAKEIKGLRIEVIHCGTKRRKHRVFNVTRYSAYNQILHMELSDGQVVDCTVAQYFSNKYNRELQYSYLPCLQVGKLERNTYLPFEVCVICPGQRCLKKLNEKQTNSMIEVTARSAPVRQKDIIELVKKNAYNKDPFIKEFDLNISDAMLEVKGRLLQPPCLQYGGQTQTQVIPSKGVWDMRDKQFHSGIEINLWTIVCFDSPNSCPLEVIGRFSQQLRKLSSDAGMPIFREAHHYTYASPDIKRIEPLFQELVKSTMGLQLVLVILPGKSRIYAEVKRVGDTILGVATQCVKAINVTKPLTQKISSLCLKINVKLGGINTILVPHIRPRVFNEPIIIMGADIFHPSAGECKKPSIAAVVGSMDAHPSRYAASVRVQPSCQKYIGEFSSMVKELLLKFYQITHFKPVRILLYRNGVPENHLDLVLFQELTAIRQACMMLESEYKPGITYIMMQKRHHTRLFCANKEEEIGSSGNIPPGTTVDSHITHPSEYDFYLCSHAGIQGTSRPCYYHVLWDDNEFKSDELQSLTYQLCYTYARCTRAVSIPAPAYYAHLVAFRARYHLLEAAVDSQDSEDMTLTAVANSIRLHKNANNGMYFA